MTSTLETLQKARDLISDPKRWTQGTLARDGAGYGVWPSDSRAVCYCSVGALSKAGRGLDTYHAVHAICEQVGAMALSEFNDTHTHAEVLAAFDAAIEKARAAE